MPCPCESQAELTLIVDLNIFMDTDTLCSRYNIIMLYQDLLIYRYDKLIFFINFTYMPFSEHIFSVYLFFKMFWNSWNFLV